MNEILKDKLKSEIKQRTEILLFAQCCFRVVETLSRYSSETDKYIKEHNFFFGFSRIALWRLVVIELCKLLTDKSMNHFSVQKLLFKFKVNNEFGNAGISESNIAEWEKLISDNHALIINLLEQRDKVYAHTDIDNEIIENKVSLENLNILLDIVRKILRQVYSKVFGVGFIFDPVPEPSQNLKWIINELVQKDKHYDELERSI